VGVGWQTFSNARQIRISCQHHPTTHIIIIMNTTIILPDAPTSTPVTRCPVDRSGFAAKSKAALQREKDAIEIFDSFRLRSGTRKIKVTATLLTPTLHLTHACWRTFSKHVHSFPGWTTTRRKATPAEKITAKEKRRKSAVYFVSVTYDPIKAEMLRFMQTKENTIKKKSLLTIGTKRPMEKVAPMKAISNKKVKHVVLVEILNDKQGTDDTNTGRVTP